MTAADDCCDICGYPPMVGVAAVPAFPVSLAWCRLCLMYGVIPLFCVESTLCDYSGPVPEGESEWNLTLAETIEKHGIQKVKDIAADWFLEVYTYVRPELPLGWNGETLYGPGRYERIGDYLDRLARSNLT